MLKFKYYGIVGIALIFLVEINFLLKVQPFANWYFPIIWLGYILLIDSLVCKLKNNSLLSNRFPQLLGMFVISALFWFIFEFLNIGVQNWSYSGIEILDLGNFFNRQLFGFLSFSTVLPALFETTELIRTLRLFEKQKLKKKYKITRRFLFVMIGAGILCFVLPFLLPEFAFPLVWLSLFLILDPINYLHKQPSIIQHFKDKKLGIPLALMASGIILGFFWEFWNYWAIPKWTYHIPYVGFLKIFEMPILGYFGYLPFALELYAMYWFARSLFIRKEIFLAR